MDNDDDATAQRAAGKPFGPGNRGKPGRRKGARNMATLVQAIASERHTIKENGKTRTYTIAELLIKALLAKSMEGDVSAHTQLERLRGRFTPPSDNAGYLVVPEPMTTEQWIRHAEASNQVFERRRLEMENQDQAKADRFGDSGATCDEPVKQAGLDGPRRDLVSKPKMIVRRLIR